MAARLQPLVGPASDRRLDQRRRVQCLAQGADGLRAIRRHQRIDRAEHAVQPIAGVAAQGLAARLDGGARAAVHAGQEQVVHFDDLVEQRFAGLDQGAGDERVALGLDEAPEIAGIVAPAQFAELAHDPRIEVVQPGSGAEQFLDQVQAGDVALDHRRIGRFRVVLEPEQARTRIAFWHFDQQVDRGAQCRRQSAGDHVVQVGRGMRHLGDDQPLERTRGRQHDPPVTQLVFGAHQELGGSAAFDGALAQPLPQISGGLAIETPDPEIAANAQRLLPLGLCPARSVEEEHRCQPELAGEVVDDLDRRVPVVIEKAAVGAKHAELQGEAATMVGTAASGDLGQIRGRQAPVPREFVLARVGRHRQPPPGLRHPGWKIIRRHSGASAPGRLRGRRMRVACR